MIGRGVAVGEEHVFDWLCFDQTYVDRGRLLAVHAQAVREAGGQ